MKKAKKLVLRKETFKKLSTKELGKLVGGYAAFPPTSYPSPRDSYSCPLIGNPPPFTQSCFCNT